MPKVKISEYSTVNSNNTDINSINIDEGCAPSGINNAIREVMVHLKNWQTNASGDGATFASLVVQGTGSFTGAVTMSAGATLSGTNTLSGSNIMSGNINSSGSTNTFSGTVVMSGANTISHAAGTVSAPSITVNGDTNTGIFFPAADTIAFSEGGAESMRIDSSGNVGIGTTSPTTQKLHISAASVSGASNNPAGLRITDTAFSKNTQIVNRGGTLTFNVETGCDYAWGINNSSVAVIDSSGNVGIGTTSSISTLTVRPSEGGGIALQRPGSTNTHLLISTNAGGVSPNYTTTYDTTNCDMRFFTYAGGGTGGNIIFGTNTSNTFAERARITSAGEFVVGKTSTGTGVGTYIDNTGVVNCQKSGTANTSTTLEVYSTGASAFRFYVGMGGTIYATSTTITAISDQRLKENIQDIDVGLDAVMSLKPRKFDWKEGKGKDKKGDRGWIAQEFEQVFPDMIDTWKDEPPEGEEPYKSVNADLIPVLVKAIQDLKAITDAQATRIEALEAEVAAMKAKA